MRFAAGLVVLAAVGGVARFAYVELVAPHHRVFTDSAWYFVQARNIRTGLGYLDIGRQYAAANAHASAFDLRPTAFWPPAYPTFLAGWQWVFGPAVLTSQLAGCALGALTVVLVGLLGRAVAGPTVGLVAAALATCSPFLLAVDGSLMSEALVVPLALVVLLLVQHARERPNATRWCAVGVALGVTALAREDSLLLFVLAVVPAAVLTRRPARDVLRWLALVVVTAALVLAPWVVRNARSVGTPEIATLSPATGLAGSNCAETYAGASIGSWSHRCTRPERGWTMPEDRYARLLRDEATRYALAHVDRWPAVVAARVGRVWGVWDPRDQVDRETAETRNRTWQWITWFVSLPLLALAGVGLWLLRRARAPIAVLVAPIALATVVAVAGYGNTRFRAVAEATLLVPVAASLLALTCRLRAGRVEIDADAVGSG